MFKTKKTIVPMTETEKGHRLMKQLATKAAVTIVAFVAVNAVINHALNETSSK